MSEKFHMPPLPLQAIVKTSVAAIAALAALATVALLLIGHLALVPTMLGSLAVVLAASLLAAWPLGLASGAEADRLIVACMLMTALRLSLTVAGIMLLVVAGAELRPAAAWAVLAYLVLLGVEVFLLVHRLAAAEPNRNALSRERAA